MYVDRMTMAYARRALYEARRAFLFDPNITLIDFGHPEHQGQIAEDELAIRIHVQRKLAGVALETAVDAGATRLIPPSIGGFATDVPQGSYRPHQWGWGGWRQRPATNPRSTSASPMRGGISISDERHYTFGTLGGLVIDRATGAEMILSNWHVLAGDWIARPGQRIYQPGRLDGGDGTNTIARLTRHAMSANLDAAVATLTSQRRLINDQFGLGPVSGVKQAELGLAVVKSGRKTGLTYGRVTGVEGVAKISYQGVDRLIRNVITIEPGSPFAEVSAGGDSGSWWLDKATMQAIGLHFAGGNSPERGLAVDMLSVLEALSVSIVTNVERPAVAPARRLALARV